MKSRTLVFVTLMGGTLFGAVSSVLISNWIVPSKAEHVTSGNSKISNAQSGETGQPAARLDSAVRSVDGKLANVAERVANLEQRAEKEPAAVDNGAPPADEVNPSDTTVTFERALEQHRAEPRDEAWAKPTESALQADLTSLQKNMHANVKDVSCRNTTCTATLEWPDRRSAQDNWQTALQAPSRAGCGREIVVPEAKPGETSVSAKMIFDCESWRADGSHLLSEAAVAALQLSPAQAAQ